LEIVSEIAVVIRGNRPRFDTTNYSRIEATSAPGALPGQWRAGLTFPGVADR
jgi:hypothetical protein